MEKRLKEYLHYLEQACNSLSDTEKAKLIKDELLIQITFFQHERLIHLLVTGLFAILSVGTFFVALATVNAVVFILLFLLLCLLVPYIRHYFILENGVQKLYTYYEKIEMQVFSLEPSGKMKK